MKQISFWAKQHKNSARVLVAIIKIVLALMAYYVGNELYQKQIHIPVILSGVTAILSIATAILYPSKKLKALSKHAFYVRQKSCDFILSACTFIFIITLANNQDTVNPMLLSQGYASFIKKHPPKAEDIIASLRYRDKSSLTRVEKRVLKKEFFKQLKVYAIAKVTGNKEKAGDVLPIVLTIIAALGLLVLLMALVCSLSCSGSDLAAAMVGLLGLAAIVWGSVVVIKHFIRKTEEK